jgi:hypothetical protein
LFSPEPKRYLGRKNREVIPMRDSLKDMPLSTALLVVVTLFVLAGSVHHVAYTFSTLEGGNLIWGYVQALGIDLGILGLAYGIQLRKRQGRPTLP